MKNGAGPACHQFVLYCRGYLEVNWHGKRKETWQQATMGGRHDCGDCVVSTVKIVDRARHDGIKGGGASAAAVGVSIFRNSASFYAPLRVGTGRSAVNRGGVQKVVIALQLSQVCPPFSRDSLLRWVGLRRRSVAEHAHLRSRSFLECEMLEAGQEDRNAQKPRSCGASMFSLANATAVRKGREGRAEFLPHLLRWSFQKRYTLVTQPLRLNSLPRNFCVTYRFWKRNWSDLPPLRVWQVRSPALSSLPPTTMFAQT